MFKNIEGIHGVYTSGSLPDVYASEYYDQCNYHSTELCTLLKKMSNKSN